jgi:hypothetical protein
VSRLETKLVVPAQAGTHTPVGAERISPHCTGGEMGPRFRGDDNVGLGVVTSPDSPAHARG